MYSVGCLYASTIFLDHEGHIWGTGKGEYLGMGDYTYEKEEESKLPGYLQVFVSNFKNVFSGMTNSVRFSPQLNPYLSNIIQISCGKEHTICIDSDGKAWGFGENNRGQLGRNNLLFTNTPICMKISKFLLSSSCGTEDSYFIDNEYNVWNCGNSIIKKTILLAPKLLDLTNIKEISCGNSHILFLTNDGFVYSFGDHHLNPALGIHVSDTSNIIDINEKIISIYAKFNHSLLITEKNELYSFGDLQNDIDVYHNVDNKIPQKIRLKNNGICESVSIFQMSSSFCIFVCNDKREIEIFCTPSCREIFTPLIPTGDIAYIFTGFAHLICKTLDGDIWVAGDNSVGQCGVASNTHANNFISPTIKLSSYFANQFGIQGYQCKKSARK